VRCNVDRTCLRIITIDEGSDVVACNFFNVKVHFWRFGDTLLALRRFLDVCTYWIDDRCYWRMMGVNDGPWNWTSEGIAYLRVSGCYHIFDVETLHSVLLLSSEAIRSLVANSLR
jgi:hypothetical protein